MSSFSAACEAAKHKMVRVARFWFVGRDFTSRRKNATVISKGGPARGICFFLGCAKKQIPRVARDGNKKIFFATCSAMTFSAARCGGFLASEVS
jgi:hypothetical protein